MNNQMIADLLKCIAHPVKLDILGLLHARNSLSVSEIKTLLGCDCEQSMLSHHLIKMKDKGILTSVKQGKNIYYSIELPAVSNLLLAIKDLELTL